MSKTLWELLVLPQFNYFTSLYESTIDVETTNHIQRVQNAYIRIIDGIRKYERVSYKLTELKWLKQRLKLQTLCL